MILLLVEDNAGLREQMKWALCADYEVVEADSSAGCVAAAETRRPPLVCLDMGLDNVPDKGLELIDAVLKLHRTAKIIVITANTSDELGPRAIARGAFDYLRKPVDIDELKIILHRAARLNSLEASSSRDAPDALPIGAAFDMLGASSAMAAIFESIRRAASADVSVLITGESGTGKELAARALHFNSARSEGPFVPINCSAIPENLIESELFGYARGAFTGATGDKKGLIEAADKGTLFLDEIADMPKNLQAKLLRFLEDHRYQRLGDVAEHQADVRVIAATNREDLSAGRETAMRSDLYFRLSECEIQLPPLRDRGDDVVLLAGRIVERNRARFNLPRLKLSPRAEDALRAYAWPGNVRELENKLNRAALSCVNQVIEPPDLRLAAEAPVERLPLREARDRFERSYVIDILRRSNHNISTASRLAGITRPTMYDLMKKHGITVTTQSTIAADS